MKKRIYIFINGVRVKPGNTRNWNSRAVTWTHNFTDARAEEVEYYSLAILRPFHQGSRAARLIDKLRSYDTAVWDIILVGHSNGCDVILDAMQKLEWKVAVKEIHFISAACTADFSGTGLNDALFASIVGEVFIYIAKRDIALLMAHTFLGRILGYGTLGITGPVNMAVTVSERPTKNSGV